MIGMVYMMMMFAMMMEVVMVPSIRGLAFAPSNNTWGPTRVITTKVMGVRLLANWGAMWKMVCAIRVGRAWWYTYGENAKPENNALVNDAF